MRTLYLFLTVAILLTLTACTDTITKTEIVYLEPDTEYIVGDVELVGQWVRESINERRIFLDNGVFRFEHMVTAEVNYDGTFYAHDGQIDLTLDDGTEFSYLYEIVYNDPEYGNATIYMTPEWITGASPITYRKVIPGYYP